MLWGDLPAALTVQRVEREAHFILLVFGKRATLLLRRAARLRCQRSLRLQR
jgi:hypothetical protein